MRKRVFFVGGILLAFGIALHTAPRADLGPDKPETWLEERAPNAVGEFKADPRLSYRMDQRTYDELNPFGIVSRVYVQGDVGFDVIMIASNRKESFHDQRVCFSAQGWTLSKDSLRFLESKTRGRVPVTLLELTSPVRGKRWALLFYKGPKGFCANPRDLAWAMFQEQLRFWTKPNLDSVFYRIIPTSERVSERELLDFAGNFLDAANASSQGYF